MRSAPGAPCWRRRPVKLQSPRPSHREQSQAIFAMVGQAFLSTEMPAVTAETMATCSATVAVRGRPAAVSGQASRHQQSRSPQSGQWQLQDQYDPQKRGLCSNRSLQSSLCARCSRINAGASSRNMLWRLTDRHLRSKPVMARTLAGDGEALPWLSGGMTASFSRQVEYIVCPCRGRIASASGGVHRTSSCSDRRPKLGCDSGEPQYEPV